MCYKLRGCLVEQSSSLGKGQCVFFYIRCTHLHMWKTTPTHLPGLQFNIRKSAVYCSYSPFRPQTLRVSIHAILKNCLHQPMHTQGLHFGSTSHKRVTQQQLNDVINL